jgi:peptide/nickel transport system ATP-binding protein
LHGIDLTLRPGEVFSLIGESGSGKSTLLNALLGFAPIAPGGRISYGGRPLTPNRRGQVHGLRPVAQLVFQDPGEALNPHWSVARAIGEPLYAGGMGSGQRQRRVHHLAAQMELAPDLLHRRPGQLSGGQRQRVCIARALATSPPWLFMDEPLSSLDPPIRRSITALLEEIATGRRTTLVMVTHQLELVRRLGGRVAVLYLGRIMESGPVAKVFNQPRHPYTRALLSSVLAPGFWSGERIVLQGEAPAPSEIPSGCVFHPRCPQVLTRCRREAPPPVAAHGHHRVACHLEVTAS